MKPREEPRAEDARKEPDSERQRATRRAAETLGLCLRCGAVLRVGAALAHDCDERPS